MNQEEIKTRLLEILEGIAPEIEPSELESDVDFREQLDMDSMDLLNFITAVHKQMGVNIPESDYPKLTSLDACVAYLISRI